MPGRATGSREGTTNAFLFERNWTVGRYAGKTTTEAVRRARLSGPDTGQRG